MQKENNVVVSKSLTTNHKGLVPFGFVQKAHGVKGEVLLTSDSGYWPKPFPQQVFIKSKISSLSSHKKFFTYKVINSRLSGKGCLLKLEGCEDRDSALLLKGCLLYLENQEFTSQKGESLFLSELIGFSVMSGMQVIGVVSQFMSHSHQDLILVQKSSKEECLIPFVKEYIHKIDFHKKVLYLNLPKGFSEWKA